MFTGIISEIGVVRRLEKAGGIYKLEISCHGVSEAAGIGDSIAANGACLTVTRKAPGILYFDVMAETIRRTALADFRRGDAVNLESSLKAGAGLDGHFVLGHIDCVGTVKEIKKSGGEFIMRITIPGGFSHLVVEKGSIAIDGASLTIGEVAKDMFSVYLIPHTLKATILGSRAPGSGVNVEFDILGKYIAKLNATGRVGITEDFLSSKGFR